MAGRILVTGAGGFVGAAVVKAAADAGHEVVALVRNDSSRLTATADRISLQRLDLADMKAVAALLSSTKPDIVIHSAWEGVGGALRSGDIQLDNIRTTVALADAAIAAGARKLVGIGSQAEYGRYDKLAMVVRFINDILLSAPSIVIGLFVYEVMVARMGHFSGCPHSAAARPECRSHGCGCSRSMDPATIRTG